MKTLPSITLALALATSAHAETQYVRAVVVDIDPIVRAVEFVECYPVQVPKYRSNSSNVLAGAIVGGVIGNHFGKGEGNVAMTALGAVLGANIAQNSSRRVVGVQTVNQCVTRYNQVVSGYLVTYQWKTLTSQLVSEYPYQIGDQFDVAVTLN